MTDLTTIAKKNSVSFSWTEPADADFTKVEISYTPGTAAPVETLKGTTTAEVTGLATDTAYVFIVKAIDAVGNKSAGVTRNVSTLPALGLVGEWLFSGNADDTSGNGNNGTVNGPVLTTDRFDNPDSAYDFDGSDDYIAINDNSTLDIADDFTLVSWAYFNGVDAQQALITKHEVSTGSGYNFVLYVGNIFCQIGDGGGWYYASVQASYTFVSDSWYHLAVTRNGAEVRFYINGSLDTTVTVGVNNIATNTHELWLGGNVDSPGSHTLDGILDDIRIYDKALSPSEIATLYHEGGWDI